MICPGGVVAVVTEAKGGTNVSLYGMGERDVPDLKDLEGLGSI